MDSRKAAALNDETATPRKEPPLLIPNCVRSRKIVMTSGQLENFPTAVKALPGDFNGQILSDGSVWEFCAAPLPIAELALELATDARNIQADFPAVSEPDHPAIVWSGPIGVVRSVADLRARFFSARAEMALALMRWFEAEPIEALDFVAGLGLPVDPVQADVR